MEQSTLYLDIETAPNMDVVGLLPEPTAKKGLTDPKKIKADIAKKALEQVDKMALDGDYGRVVCASWAVDDHEVIVETVDKVTEHDIVQECMKQIGANATVVTFNGKHFDLPFLWTRAWHLGVTPAYPMPDVNKYRDQWHVDLALVLTFRGQLPLKKLGQYCRLYGVGHDDALTGSQVGEWVKAGEWKKIADHNRDDVESLRALAKKIPV